MPIIVNLDVMLAKRKMSLSQLSEQVGVPSYKNKHTQISAKQFNPIRCNMKITKQNDFIYLL